MGLAVGGKEEVVEAKAVGGRARQPLLVIDIAGDDRITRLRIVYIPGDTDLVLPVFQAVDRDAPVDHLVSQVFPFQEIVKDVLQGPVVVILAHLLLQDGQGTVVGKGDAGCFFQAGESFFQGDIVETKGDLLVEDILLGGQLPRQEEEQHENEEIHPFPE